ncbi:MAG: PAS domain S-box-containing protein [Cryomorphaceae bacterium]|jgi:PAS domain S-box-containing protein
MKVLIVEDSGSQAEKLRLILEMHDYEPVVASNGEAALEFLSANSQVQLVVSDVVMPGMSGHELCRRIRGTSGYNKVPVLLMTSSTDPMEVIQCIQAGADAFLAKPYEPEVLIARIASLEKNRIPLNEHSSKIAAKISVFDREIELNATIAQLTNLFVSTIEDASLTNRKLGKSRRELAQAKSKLEKSAVLIKKELGVTKKNLNIRNQAIVNLKDALLIISAEGDDYIIEDANPAVESVIGYTPAMLIGKPPPIFTDNVDDYTRFIGLLDSVERSNSMAEYSTFKILSKDGSSRWCEIRVSVISDTSDSTTRYACALWDTTSDHMVREATEYLSRRDSTGTNFLSGVLLQLHRILDIDMALVCEFHGNQAKALAIIEDGKIVPNFNFPVQDTPYQDVIEHGHCHITTDAKQRYPKDDYFTEKNIDAYIGEQIQNGKGVMIGSLSVMCRSPISSSDAYSKVLGIFSIAVGAELERGKLYRQYQQLFHFAPDAMMMIDDRGMIQLINQRTKLMFGYSSAELIGRPIAYVVPTFNVDDQVTWLQACSEGLASGGTFLENTDLKGVAENGRVFPIEISLNPMEDGRAKLNVVAVRDVSSRVEQQQDQLARRVAEDANSAKSDFLATMSHEIRTPINGVMGSAELLARMSMGEEQQELVDTINESGRALLAVIDEILDFSKIEAGKLEIDKSFIRLEGLVESVCKNLLPVAIAKAVTVNLFIDPELPAVIISDSVRLRQILNNLISNAIKFSANPEKTGHVKVRLETTSRQHMKLTVKDNGIGMSKLFQESSFVPFTQAETSTTRSFGGTGLGLSICKRLIELLGGDITVESAEGEGTTFIVNLPLEQDDADKQAVETADLEGLQCVLISKNQSLAEDWQQYLSHAGASVQVFTDLEQATDAVGESPAGETIILAHGDQDATQQWHAGLKLESKPIVVIMQWVEQRSSLKLIEDGILLLEFALMPRRSLLTAVAVAAGRESLTADEDQLSYEEVAHVEPPDRETVIARGQLILVTEDNPVNQTLIRKQLSVLGYLADVVDDGELGLQAWRSGDYSLLLTDLHMPKMDGYELVQAIRKESQDGPKPPVIALTANALKGEREKCLAAGMDDYLSKPISLPSLQAKLEQWLPRPERFESEKKQNDRRSGHGSRNNNNEAEAESSVPGNAVTAAATSVIDLNEVKKLVRDDTAIINRLCDEFRQTLITDKASIQQAFAEDEPALAADLAHRVKSSARMFGAKELGDCCEQIEKLGRTGAGSLQQEMLPTFTTLAEQVLAALNDLQ